MVIRERDIHRTESDILTRVDGKVYSIKKTDLDSSLECNLSLFYKKRLEQFTDEVNIHPIEALEFLLDIYYLDNARVVRLLSKQLSKRLFKGVDRSFIIQIRTLYTVLGHFLKRLRYI